jgi:hypothetical protein
MAIGLPLVPVAHADNCSISQNEYGQTSVMVGNTAIAAYFSLDDALANLKKLKDSGACTGDSACSISKDEYGRIALMVGKAEVASAYDLGSALESYKSLQDSGICQPDSTCTLAMDEYGRISVKAGGKALSSSYSLADALAAVQKLKQNGLCGDDQGSCVLRQTLHGVSVYTKNGQQFIGNYDQLYTARLIVNALARAGACSR